MSPTRLRPSQGGRFHAPIIGDVTKPRGAAPIETSADLKSNYPGPRPPISPDRVIRFLVTTTSCAGVLAWDQVNLFGETPPIDATYALADVALQDSRFPPREMNRFLRACPFMLRNVMIVDHPRARSAAAILVNRGQLASYTGTYAQVSDWQTSRAQIPMAERLDGETSLRVILPMLAVARTFSIYATLERRR